MFVEQDTLAKIIKNAITRYQEQIEKLVEQNNSSFEKFKTTRRLIEEDINNITTISLEELAEAVEAGTELEHIYPMDRIKASMPHLVVGADKVFNIEHGQVVPDDFFGEPLKELTAIFNEAGTLLAIYGPHPSKPNLLKSAKGFHYEEEVNA